MSTLVILGLCVFFVYTAIRIFSIRFSKGDIYPKYSSMRSDPLGTKALYESYSMLEHITVSRNMRPLYEISEENVFLLRAGMENINAAGDAELFKFMLGGGRVAVFFSGKCGLEDKKTRKKEGKSEDGRETAKKDEWKKMEAGKFELIYDGRDQVFPRKASPEPDFAEFGCFDNDAMTYFKFANPASWKIIFTDPSGRPVVAETAIGKGKLIVSAGSYVISNEGLRKNPQPAFLAWLPGGRNNIIFDESAHGFFISRNIVWLLSRYRLEFLALNIILIVVLLLWRNAFSFSQESNKSFLEAIAAKENSFSSSAGLETLLGKIPEKKILKYCFDEWLKPGNTRFYSEHEIQELKTIATESENSRDPVATYNKANKILTERKHFHYERK